MRFLCFFFMSSLCFVLASHISYCAGVKIDFMLFFMAKKHDCDSSWYNVYSIFPLERFWIRSKISIRSRKINTLLVEALRAKEREEKRPNFQLSYLHSCQKYFWKVTFFGHVAHDCVYSLPFIPSVLRFGNYHGIEVTYSRQVNKSFFWINTDHANDFCLAWLHCVRLFW